MDWETADSISFNASNCNKYNKPDRAKQVHSNDSIVGIEMIGNYY